MSGGHGRAAQDGRLTQPRECWAIMRVSNVQAWKGMTCMYTAHLQGGPEACHSGRGRIEVLHRGSSGVRCVVCGVRCAVCGVWCVV